MTIAFVQQHAGGANSASGTTCVATVTGQSTPGNLLVMVLATNGATADDVTSIAENSTESGDANAWQYVVKLGQNQGGQTTIHVFTTTVRRIAHVGDTITTTVSATESRQSLGIWEYSGFIQPIIKKRAFASGTATSLSHAGYVPTDAPALQLWAIANNTGASAGQSTTSPTGGYTIRLGGNNSGGGSVQKEATLLDQVVTTTASISGGATDANTVGWVTEVFCVVEGFGMTYKNPRGSFDT